MMKPPLEMLCISADDSRLQEHLRDLKSRYDLHLSCVTDAAALADLSQKKRWQLALADGVPLAREGLVILRAYLHAPPMIVLCDATDEPAAAHLLSQGACDYVRKDDAIRLRSVVARELLRSAALTQANLWQPSTPLGPPPNESGEMRAISTGEADVLYREIYLRTSELVMLIGIRPDGSFVVEKVNRAAERAIGRSAAECVGKTPHELFPHPSASQLVDRYLECVEAGTPLSHEQQLVLGSAQLSCETVLVPLRDAGGKIVRLASISRDVSQRKESEKELRAAEQKLRHFFQNTPLGVIEWDREQHVTVWNRVAEQIFGYPPEDAIGQDAGLILDPAGTGDLIDKFLSDNKPGIQSTHSHVTKSGLRIHCDWYNTTLTDAAGQPVGVVSLVQDVTVQTQALDALRESENRFRAYFEAPIIGFAILRPDGDIQDVNHKLCGLLGLPREVLIHKDWIGLAQLDDQPAQEKLLGQLVKGSIETGSLEVRYPKRDGTILYASLQFAAIRTNEGETSGIVAAVNDVTRQKEGEALLRRLNAELEERVADRTARLADANRELEAFSYSVSHDLRTPLRAIDGFSKALLEDYGERLDAEGKDYLSRVRLASQRMGELIDELLGLSRVTRVSLRPTAVNLSDLARQIRDSYREIDPARVVEWVIAPGVTARGDPNLLRIVFDNLLGNAWKYTARHTRARIEFGTFQEEGNTVYFVQDDGAGFDPAYGSRLFRPFQRLHRPNEFEGHGIGLATVQRIIRRHGGKIWATGMVDKGAKFFFTLGRLEEPTDLPLSAERP